MPVTSDTPSTHTILFPFRNKTHKLPPNWSFCFFIFFFLPFFSSIFKLLTHFPFWHPLSSLFGRLWRRFFHLRMWCPCYRLLQILTGILLGSDVPLQGGGWAGPYHDRGIVPLAVSVQVRGPLLPLFHGGLAPEGRFVHFVCPCLCNNFKQ